MDIKCVYHAEQASEILPGNFSADSNQSLMQSNRTLIDDAYSAMPGWNTPAPVENRSQRRAVAWHTFDRYMPETLIDALHYALKEKENETVTANYIQSYFPGLCSVNIKDCTVGVLLNEQDFITCRITYMRLGRYLKRIGYFDSTEINIISNAFKTYLSLLSGAQLQIATTQEEIKHVYVNGPDSCMKGNYFDGDVHPACVYATEDCGVAYIQVGERIVARGVINRKDKQFTTMYGNTTLLRAALEAADYESGDICGCRILKITNVHDQYIMPYIDDADTVGDLDDTYFIVGDYGHYCQNTTGVADDCTTCVNCGDSVDPDECIWIEDEGHVCSGSCADNIGYVWCDDVDDYRRESSVYYSQSDHNYYVSCDNLVEVSGEWYDSDDSDIVWSEDQDEYLFANNAVWVASIDSWVDDHRESEFEEKDEEEDCEA